MSELTIFTIGHSTHDYGRFLELVRGAGISAIADVRTSPWSRHFPQFNRDTLKDELKVDGIAYSFLGKELGGRPAEAKYYRGGVADYERMAEAPDFKRGLERVLEGARKYRVAMMCSEHDPLDCHRCLLVGRALSEQGVAVKHILADGTIAEQAEIEERLLQSSGEVGDDLFRSREERLADAYRARARKVAYSDPDERTAPRTAAE